ncbi:AsmA family protein [Corallincola spongiicola]|uniref:AsmA family protein n=2 Tax=Corallincola spongiicola TaxID=2520508 RepID=A0ABY1WTE4_9GAMM|nr:AsmA family protein [Corallincola spongiicola]
MMITKRLLVVLCSLFILGLVLLSVAFHLVDPNEYRVELEKRVLATTGRQLTITGDAELKLFPQPYFAINNVSLANAPWGSTPLMLKTDYLDIQMAWLPLLMGELHVRKVRLRGAEVIFEKNADGISNWKFEGQLGDSNAVLPTFEWIAVENSAIVWRDTAKQNEHTLGIDSLRIEPSESGNERFSWDVSGKLDGVELLVAGEMSSLIRHFNGEPWQGDISLTTQGLAFNISGKTDDVFELKGLDVHVNASGDDLSQLQHFTGLELSSPMPWHLAFDLRHGVAEFNAKNINVRVGESDIAGSLTLKESTRRWRVDGQLHSKVLNLDPLLAATSTDNSSTTEQVSAEKVFSDRPFSVNWMRDFDGHVQLDIQQFSFAALHAANSVLDMKLSDDVLMLAIEATEMFHGKVSADATIDSSHKLPLFHIKATGTDVEMAEIVGLMTDMTFLEGQGHVNVDVQGQGDSLAALMASMTGEGRALISEGTAELRAAETATSIRRLLISQLGDKDDKRVKMNCLAAHVTVKDGVSKPTAVVVDTKKSTVRGAGTIDFGKETLDMVFTPKPKSSAISLGVPLAVTGTFYEPKSSLEKLGAARRVAGIASLFIFPPAALAGLGDLGDNADNCITISENDAK